ncbi:TPA: hypothetical protein DDW69_03550 [candidate division CPR2 bacterium]|uniref:PGAP1 family protein n=1 Tax=candidate division CPR2 bacterium GW2011_GWC1_41_48 TaxID=1618344 RepID=A0A0G0YHJ5_UNCC2|nr:MAG: PGAP1 family protein [candidate division CPR2 bacterium GW2011_GWC2_39_35]KKR28806.1 MAG: PGAP1 family protein [candidate division CPR2 bacterium GW2011_GWD2_39_7]KKS09036.1 MAG: PGAP1 family protein [candidate division CPR2 bacterium GW2011_GWC1_41_48]OGB73165.1 MAG: hypothetical protein A2Y26_03585 [candidate division CPR2 bacterium GWD2_39_7]HBG81890.1 hypothetical protein [candidate division CPR2 bacterium]
MQEQKVTITNKYGEKLVGLKTIPNEVKDKYPTVVLVHGFNIDKREGGLFDRAANYLADKGFLVYRFDFSGCGESDGDFSDTTLTKMAEELGSILQFVKLDKDIDGNRIGIWAQSYGVCVALALKPDVTAMVLASSNAHPKNLAERMHVFDPDGISYKKRSSGSITFLKSGYWDDLDKYDLVKNVSEINAPILLIHGTKDDKLAVSETEELYESANDPKRKVILKMEHGWKPKEKEVYKLATDWFNKYLD